MKPERLGGGSQIAEGSYGCYFEPQLPCPGKAKPSSGGTKIMANKAEVDQELEVARMILNIDPKHEFSSVPDSQCALSREKAEKMEPTLNRCTVPEIEQASTVQLLQTNDNAKNTVDLSRFVGFSKLPPKALSGLANLFRGLHTMHSNNVFHNDVHPTNIIVSKDSGQMKFIDFGLSFQVNPKDVFAKNTLAHLQILEQTYTARRVPFGQFLFQKWALHHEEIKNLPSATEFVRWNKAQLREYNFSKWKGASYGNFTSDKWISFLAQNAFAWWTLLQMGPQSDFQYAQRYQDLAGMYTVIQEIKSKLPQSIEVTRTIETIVTGMHHWLMKGNALTRGLSDLPWLSWASLLEKAS